MEKQQSGEGRGQQIFGKMARVAVVSMGLLTMYSLTGCTKSDSNIGVTASQEETIAPVNRPVPPPQVSSPPSGQLRPMPETTVAQADQNTTSSEQPAAFFGNNTPTETASATPAMNTTPANNTPVNNSAATTPGTSEPKVASAAGEDRPDDSTPDGEMAESKPTSLLTGVPAIPDSELKLADLIERVEPAVVRINTRSSAGYSIGSGYVVSSDGTVVTNYHVIEGAKEASVEFADGTKLPVLGFKHYDADYDIAIIQIQVPEKGLSVVPLADQLPRKGDTVVAFGAPHGLSFTTTEGIISAIRTQEEMNNQLGLNMKGSWLQTSTPISPGNSGGPLVDLYGRVVAMNTMQLTSGQNLNFAVSAGDVKSMLEVAASKPLEKMSPEKLQEVDRSVKRRLAPDITGTERGNQLLTKVDEIFLILLYKISNFDPTGAMTNSVNSHAELAISKAGIELSFGEPSGDAAIMIVTVDMKPMRNAAPGTQKLVVDAFLICEDPEQASTNKLVKIWTAEETEIGTVALQAIARGQLPRTISAELTKFFNKFRLARTKASRGL